MKQILVQNYLNLNKTLFIIFMTITILSYIIFHFFTIERNKAIQEETKLTGASYLAPNGLVVLAAFETFVQLLPFYHSYALRLDEIELSCSVSFLFTYQVICKEDNQVGNYLCYQKHDSSHQESSIEQKIIKSR